MSGEVELIEIARASAPRLNVIFVHGLGGDARGTWTFETKASTPGPLGRFFGRAPSSGESHFWPEWLAENMYGLAVWSLNYPSDPKRWKPGWAISQSAVAVLDALMVHRALRGNGAPIVFICHSLGGLVIKKLIVTANIDRGQEPKKGAFLDRVAGVAFLATPHGGSFLATLAREFHWVIFESLRDLDGNAPDLLHLASSYRSMIEDKGRRIAHRVYYEDEGVAGVKVVDGRSADPGLTGVRPVAILRDHFGICKLQKRDQIYDGVLALLEKALEPRPELTREIAEQTKDDTAAIRTQQKGDSAKLAAVQKQLEQLAAAIDPALTQRAKEKALPKAPF